MADDHGGGGKDDHGKGGHGHSSGEERTFHIKVDRTSTAPPPHTHLRHDGSSPPPPKAGPIVDYFRLGSPSDVAKFDSHKSVEKEAKESFLKDEPLSKIKDHIGGAGVFLSTSGDSTTVVDKNSFTRVGEEAYFVYGEKHEIVDEGEVVSGAMDSIFGLGLEYKVSRAMEYEAGAEIKLAFGAGAEYESKVSASFEAKAGVGLELSLAAGIEVDHGIKAEFNWDGEFESGSTGLKHSETPVYFGEKSLTLGLDHDPIHGTLKSALKNLARLLQLGEAAYAGNGTAAVVRLGAFKKDPTLVEGHVTAAEVIALVQFSLALISGIVCGIAGNIQKKKADALAEGGDGLLQKPFIRIDEPAHTNRIVLDTGQGASITLTGDKIKIAGMQIDIETTGANPAGPINVRSGQALSMRSVDNMVFTAEQNATMTGAQGIVLSAPNQTITSYGNQWTHNGAFQAGATTLGATNATSINVNNQPVVTQPALVQDLDTLQARIAQLDQRLTAEELFSVRNIGTLLYLL